MKYFIISIDTERDCSPDWSTSNPMTVKNITYGIPSILQPLFNKYAAVPTYLLGVEILNNSDCVEVFRKLNGNYELGTHLHGEFIAPGKFVEDLSGFRTEDFSCFYEETLEFEKLSNITNLFYDRFGYNPTSFRAGRYGAGVSTLKSLQKLGYKVDSSVTPLLSWRSHQGVIDFRKASNQPYHPDLIHDISKSGKESSILEVPISIVKSTWGKIKWLRPFYSNFGQMVSVLDKLEKNGARGGNVFANLMFHSMEILPAASPYPQNEDEVRKFLSDLENILTEAKNREYKFIGLSEVVKYL
jgi:hypothetical protein